MKKIDFINEAEKLFGYTQALRRDFHAHPELGFQEYRTAGIVARELGELGLEVSTGVGQTGVVAMIEGDMPGANVLIRVDMDALPIVEETGAAYASKTRGVMHACGHDGHTAIGLTVARMLAAHRSQLKGSVKMVFQPAEEGLGGAEGMITDGVLANPRPDYALAVHLWNDSPLGWLGITPGPVMAAADVFNATIRGKGGHGAAPHQAIDPVFAAAQVISALQSIVSRSVSPLNTAVVSVTQVHGGDAFNVIPPEVKLSGTIRTFDRAVREHVLERFFSIIQGVSASLGCVGTAEIVHITPPVVNDPQITTLVKQTAAEAIPEAHLNLTYQTMGSEDMAFMLQEIPGCYFFVGSANAEAGLDAAHHHPRFDFDEHALVHASGLMASAAVRLLEMQ
jgi:amidohydrolase